MRGIVTGSMDNEGQSIDRGARRKFRCSRCNTTRSMVYEQSRDCPNPGCGRLMREVVTNRRPQPRR